MKSYFPLFLFFSFLAISQPEEAELEELFQTASLWEVGENKTRVAEARQKLISFGEIAINFIVRKKIHLRGTLEFRAMQAVVQGVGEPSASILLSALPNDDPYAVRNIWNLLSSFPFDTVLKYQAKEKIIALLQSSLSGTSPDFLRRATCGAIAVWRVQEMLPTLHELLLQNINDAVAIPCIKALKEIGAKESLFVLLLLLDPRISTAPKRFSAEEALKAYGPKIFFIFQNFEIIPAGEEEKMIYRHLLKILGAVSPEDDPKSLSLFKDALNHNDWGIRASAVEGLTLMKGKKAFALLQKYHSKEGHPYVLFLINKALSRLPQNLPAGESPATVAIRKRFILP
ncbi:MAG: hypothetical protein ACK4G3_01675 [bacterium]